MDSFQVTSLANQSKCFKMEAEWSGPSGYNVTGDIEAYVVQWEEDDTLKNQTFFAGDSKPYYIDNLNPNDYEYTFSVSVMVLLRLFGIHAGFWL